MKSDARKAMLKSLSKEMRGEIGKGYEDGGLKDKLMKVTVASDSPEGVEKGLNKAEEIMKKRIGPMEDEAEDMMEMGEGLVGDVMDEDGDMESPMEEIAEEEVEEEFQSPDEIREMIAELQEKLAMMEE